MKQVFVIGIGNFGFYLAKELYAKGYEVIAVDRNGARIQEIRDEVTRAIVADSTDPDALQSLGIAEADLVVISIGSNLSASILTALNVKDLGVRKVYAKAMSEAHGRILEKIGVSEVMFPEKDLALAAAQRIHNPNMIDYLPFIDGYTILELAPLENFIGKKLKELDLTNRFGIQIIAVKDVLSDQAQVVPTGEYMIKDSDILILFGAREKIEKLRQDG